MKKSRGNPWVLLVILGLLLFKAGGIAWADDPVPTPTSILSPTPTLTPASTPGFPTGVVITNANLRQEPSTDAKIIMVVGRGTLVQILNTNEKWYRVKLADEKEGWIAKELISTDSKMLSSRDRFISRSKEIIAFAQRYIGVGYRYGGSSPYGFDCSGFSMFVYNQFGYKLPHNAAAQAELGTSLERDELLPGDLVFFATVGSNYISHVGIYIGNDRFIHASTYDYIICINSLSERYYAIRYREARRILDFLNEQN